MASTDYPTSWGPLTDPAVKKWWDSQSSDNKKSWNLHSQLSNKGMVERHNQNVQNAIGQNMPKGGQPRPQPQQPEQPGAKPRPIGNQPNGPGSPMNYQSGINVGGGIGKQGILNGLLDTGTQPNPNVSAFSRATAWNDASQIGRGIDAQNQDIRMQQQAKRSESTTEGASNMAKIAGDYAERGISQTNLAAQIAANNIGFAGGIAKMNFQWPTNLGAYKG